MKSTTLLVVSLLAATSITGCADTQEYEVTGEVSSAQTVAGPITLEFFAFDEADEEAVRESVKTAELEALGPFAETIEVSPDDTIIVLALVDEDGDGQCTDGELWAEAQTAPQDDDTVPEILLELSAAACPAE